MNNKKINPNRPAIARSNPFSTRFVRPGAVEYIFPRGDDAQQMVERLREAAWQGEIVGPHGSGKSALLATLMPAIRRAGKKPLLVELHDGQRRLPIDPARLPLERERAIIIVDGYEQLGWWSRSKLRRFCRRKRIGLLITSHRSMGFPELHRTYPTPELAQQIVVRLLAGKSCPEPALTDIQAAFDRHGGDIREMLFELYDHFEQQPRSAPRRYFDQKSETSPPHKTHCRRGSRT